MSTECTQTSFIFEPHGRRDVVARFDGGAITSDAGALLLRQVDQRLNLLPRLAACFHDRRDPQRIERIVEQIREVWPQVRIVVRGDAGFSSEALMSWCEANGVD